MNKRMAWMEWSLSLEYGSDERGLGDQQVSRAFSWRGIRERQTRKIRSKET